MNASSEKQIMHVFENIYLKKLVIWQEIERENCVGDLRDLARDVF